MGKRSDFERNPRDFYPTPEKAVEFLVPHLDKCKYFIEPFAGDGSLIKHIENNSSSKCIYASDIEPQIEKLGDLKFETHSYKETDVFRSSNGLVGRYFISNPPWINTKASGFQLNDIIHTLSSILPTWLLLSSDYAFNLNSALSIERCTDIVPTSRLKWIPDSKYAATDNCAWYRFDKTSQGAKLWPRIKI